MCDGSENNIQVFPFMPFWKKRVYKIRNQICFFPSSCDDDEIEYMKVQKCGFPPCENVENKWIHFFRIQNVTFPRLIDGNHWENLHYCGFSYTRKSIRNSASSPTLRAREVKKILQDDAKVIIVVENLRNISLSRSDSSLLSLVTWSRW